MVKSPSSRAAVAVAVFGLCCSARAGDGRPLDTLLVDSAELPDFQAVSLTQSIDPASVDKSITARLFSPVAPSVSLGVSSTFDDLRTLDPSPSLRYRILSQERHGVSLTGIIRYKTTGFFARTGEVQAGISLARQLGRIQITANGAVASASNGAGMALDAKLNTSWRMSEYILVGMDCRVRADLADNADVEARGNPNARDFELTIGPAMSWQLGLVQLQGLVGAYSPKGTGQLEPTGMLLANFGF